MKEECRLSISEVRTRRIGFHDPEGEEYVLKVGLERRDDMGWTGAQGAPRL
jgi:hypothetical protein